MKEYVCNGVCLVELHLGANLRLEIALLPEKGEQVIPVALNLARVEGRSRGEIGHLNQAGEGESIRTRKSEDPEVNSGLQDQQHPDTVRLRLHLKLNFFEVAVGLEGGDGLVDLLPGKRLACVQCKVGCELLLIEIGLAGEFDRRDVLTLIGRQNLLRLRRRFGSLLGCWRRGVSSPFLGRRCLGCLLCSRGALLRGGGQTHCEQEKPNCDALKTDAVFPAPLW